ncbi:MAG: hypothetical protein J1F64_04825, partial [Oscillospiraceae bacterium]|nr:hypothetical protein [Oscillospiraceae bacterium]
MYCKYCGNRLAQNSVKCAACGANIDLNDGGQSFFDDNELDAWQSEGINQGPKTSMPKTEILGNDQRDHNDFIKGFSPRAPQMTGRRTPAYSVSYQRHGKNNNLSSIADILSSNRLIILCIAAALVIALCTAAVIAVLNRGNTTEDEDNSGVTQTEQPRDAVQENMIVTDPVPAEVNNETTQEDEKPEEAVSERRDVEIEVKIDGKDVKNPGNAYMQNNLLYVSYDKILKYEGYEYKKSESKGKIVYYEKKQDNKAVKIEKNDPTEDPSTSKTKIWIIESGK